MSETRIGENLRAYCSKCRGERNCRIHGHFAESGGDAHYDWRKDWYLLTCCGCDHVFAQSVSTNSEDFYEYTDHLGEDHREYEETVRQWPAKSVRERQDWFEGDSIESEKETGALDTALLEVYSALDNGLIVLASIGIRTCFDVAAEALGADGGQPFERKVQDLLERGLIRESEKDHIDILVDAGSAAAHRGWKPQLQEVDTLMGILEDFIFNNFVAPGREKAREENIERMKARVPKKPARKKAQKKAIPSAI